MDNLDSRAGRDPFADAELATVMHLGHLLMSVLPVDGVAFSISDPQGNPMTLYASDSTATRLDDLQFDLGEGPLFQAYKSSSPVLIPVMQLDSSEAWPIFILSARLTPARALFVIPLMMGAVTVGVASLYRNHAGALSDSSLTRATAIASASAVPVFRLAITRSTGEATDNDPLSFALRREVHQAIGMVLAQLDITATDAFARLRAHAYAQDQTLHEVVQDVLALTLDFSRLDD